MPSPSPNISRGRQLALVLGGGLAGTVLGIGVGFGLAGALAGDQPVVTPVAAPMSEAVATDPAPAREPAPAPATSEPIDPPIIATPEVAEPVAEVESEELLPPPTVAPSPAAEAAAPAISDDELATLAAILDDIAARDRAAEQRAARQQAAEQRAAAEQLTLIDEELDLRRRELAHWRGEQSRLELAVAEERVEIARLRTEHQLQQQRADEARARIDDLISRYGQPLADGTWTAGAHVQAQRAIVVDAGRHCARIDRAIAEAEARIERALPLIERCRQVSRAAEDRIEALMRQRQAVTPGGATASEQDAAL